MAEREKETTTESLKNLLGRYSEVHSEEFLAEEKAKVETAQTPYRQQCLELIAQAKKVAEEIEKPRKEVEDELFGILSEWISIDTATPTDLYEYRPGRTFGIGRESVLRLVEFALDKEVDVGGFLGFCEKERVMLQSKRKDNFFSGSDLEKWPDLEFIERTCLVANQSFRDCFLLDILPTEYAKRNSQTFFNIARSNFEKVNLEEGNLGAAKAFSAFLEFMATDDAFEVFKGSTTRKIYYETFAVKRK